jgi:predicted RNase H-like nuclease (RuvC/YqgF family)
MSSFDVFEDDPLEQRMKSTIAEWFRDEQSRKLEQARSLAVKLEGENASLERALHEAEREIDRLNRALEVKSELAEDGLDE